MFRVSREFKYTLLFSLLFYPQFRFLICRVVWQQFSGEHETITAAKKVNFKYLFVIFPQAKRYQLKWNCQNICSFQEFWWFGFFVIAQKCAHQNLSLHLLGGKINRWKVDLCHLLLLLHFTDERASLSISYFLHISNSTPLAEAYEMIWKYIDHKVKTGKTWRERKEKSEI